MEQEFFGNSIVENVQPVQLDVEKIWRDQQRRRFVEKMRVEKTPQTSFVNAANGEKGKQYVITLDDAQGTERFVKADFLTAGRGEFAHLSFFRRQLKGGSTVVHGIAGYTLVKEVGYDNNARD